MRALSFDILTGALALGIAVAVPADAQIAPATPSAPLQQPGQSGDQPAAGQPTG